MKKRLVFVFLIFSLILVVYANHSKAITGETITGEASNQNLGVSLYIASSAPSLNLLNPKNGTYISNESLLLDYLVSGEDTVWYNLDGSSNITITSPTYFNTTQGKHTLYIYANNTDNILTTKTVNFSVNISKFLIIDDEYDNEGYDVNDDDLRGYNKRQGRRGISTEFLDYSFEELQSLSNIILDNPGYGRIQFNQPINLTDDADTTDNQLDLDTYTNISSNRIEINSTALPNFNKSATLYLYNLTFTNPRILRDGEVCPSDICILESYSNGTLKFNVTGFTIYSAEETPYYGEEAPITEEEVGGGGGGGITKKPPFSVEPEIINIKMKQGEIFKLDLKIKNTGKSIRKFKIKQIALEGFIVVPEKEFFVGAGEEKTIRLIFTAPSASTHTGKIIVLSEKIEKEVPVILGIKSRVLLFDITLNVPPKYKNVEAGENVSLDVSIFNLGEIEEANLEVRYYIKDFEGKTITQKEENITIGKHVSFSKILKLPKNISDGQYLAGVDVKYDVSLGTASDIFNVKSEEIALPNITLVIVVGITILTILISTILIIRHFNKKIKQVSRKPGARGFERALSRGRELGYKLGLISQAYDRGYIKKGSYEKGKRRISSAFENLKKKSL